jgi:hypothetical protein
MNDTDRELLELAAKAAGLEYECVSHTGRPENDQHQVRDQFGGLVDWNPLADDGDALRLAVKADIDISQFGDFARADCMEYVSVDEPYGDDPLAATRRAIVRAAAEIGGNMK